MSSKYLLFPTQFRLYETHINFPPRLCACVVQHSDQMSTKHWNQYGALVFGNEMNSLIFIVHWNVEGKERSKGNHDLRMELRNEFGRWMEEKSEENKVSFQVFTCYFQDAGLTLNYIFSWVDNTVQVCYLVWILLGFIFSIIIDGDFVRFFTMNMAYWISLDDYILTDLQEIF